VGIGECRFSRSVSEEDSRTFFIKQEEAFGIVGQFVLSRPTATRHPDDRMS
jgi:hypothetical protein